LHLSEQFNAKTPRRKDITGIVLDVNSDCPLSLWERVGVRVNNRIASVFIAPHPNLLPRGEGVLR
jgi:hypothetical protein